MERYISTITPSDNHNTMVDLNNHIGKLSIEKWEEAFPGLFPKNDVSYFAEMPRAYQISNGFRVCVFVVIRYDRVNFSVY